MSDRGHESGFTLVELLVVMMIVSILAGIAIPTFIHHRQDARRMVITPKVLPSQVARCFGRRVVTRSNRSLITRVVRKTQ